MKLLDESFIGNFLMEGLVVIMGIYRLKGGN